MGGTEGAGGKGNDVSERTTTSIPKTMILYRSSSPTLLHHAISSSFLHASPQRFEHHTITELVMLSTRM